MMDDGWDGGEVRSEFLDRLEVRCLNLYYTSICMINDVITWILWMKDIMALLIAWGSQE